METSPAEVKEVGRLEVTAVSETEKRDDPVSLTLKRLPIVPFVPILRENKSPVAVVAEPGLQSNDNKLPVVRPFVVEEMYEAVPVVKEFALIVDAVVVVPVNV